MPLSPGCRLVLLTVAAYLAVALPAWGGDKAITWFLDGARVEVVAEAPGGFREISLPAAMLEGSFRVKPVGNVGISRVEIVAVKPDRAAEKELAKIAERRDALNDRLQALAVKEEVFTAAAKSQGGKAPRRTRTNPDPLTAIRQGTDFAIARMEDVYRAKRQTKHELKQLEQRLSVLQKQENVSGKTARVWLTGKLGSLVASYIVAGEGWQPRYDVRLSGATALVDLFAHLPRSEKGAKAAVVPARLAEALDMAPIPVNATALPKVATYTLPIVSLKRQPGLQTIVTVSLRNGSSSFLPPGEVSGFLDGEFLGATAFPGVKPGETVELQFGR